MEKTEQKNDLRDSAISFDERPVEFYSTFFRVEQFLESGNVDYIYATCELFGYEDLTLKQHILCFYGPIRRDLEHSTPLNWLLPEIGLQKRLNM